MNLEAILTCSCPGMGKKSTTAFSLLFPDRAHPVLYRGEDQVRKLADEHPDTNVERYLRAVARQKGKWAYYVSTDDAGNITKLYDLTTGRRVG